MNMERRALLAFVLSMLVFLAFDLLYYSPRTKKEQEIKRTTAQQRAKESGSTEVTGGSARVEIPALPESPEAGTHEKREEPLALPLASPDKDATVQVITPLYRVTLSGRGGEIISAKLSKYETRGAAVELFPQLADSSQAMVSNIALLGEEKRASLCHVLFRAHLKGEKEPLEDGALVTLDEEHPEAELVFRAKGEEGREVLRYYRFSFDSYEVEAGISFAASSFPFVRRISWGLGPGLRSTEINHADDYMNFQASVRLGEEIRRLKLGSFSNEKTEMLNGTLWWASLQTKYFTAVLIPEKPVGADVEVAGKKGDHFLTASIELPIEERRGIVDQRITIYLGPLDYSLLKSMGLGLEKNINMGYKLFRPVSWVILWSLIALYKVVPNYGIVIILISIFTKVLFYRLTHKSFKSMRDMQALQPKLQALKEKYKDDRQKLSAETMKLYKQHGVNPLGGCLPLLLQAPVFIALFSVLKFTIELRGAYFVGWINDLSQPDVLYKLPFSLPFIGRDVSVLPILMGAAMVLQTKIGGSITGSSPSATQPKALTYMLPIVFTVIFYKMPSGLVLYWLVNNVLSIAQQYYINKEKKGEKPEEEVKTKKSKRSGKKGKVMHPWQDQSKLQEKRSSKRSIKL